MCRWGLGRPSHISFGMCPKSTPLQPETPPRFCEAHLPRLRGEVDHPRVVSGSFHMEMASFARRPRGMIPTPRSSHQAPVEAPRNSEETHTETPTSLRLPPAFPIIYSGRDTREAQRSGNAQFARSASHAQALTSQGSGCAPTARAYGRSAHGLAVLEYCGKVLFLARPRAGSFRYFSRCAREFGSVPPRESREPNIR